MCLPIALSICLSCTFWMIDWWCKFNWLVRFPRMPNHRIINESFPVCICSEKSPLPTSLSVGAGVAQEECSVTGQVKCAMHRSLSISAWGWSENWDPTQPERPNLWVAVLAALTMQRIVKWLYGGATDHGGPWETIWSLNGFLTVSCFWEVLA